MFAATDLCCIQYVMHTVDVHSSSEVCSSTAVTRPS